MKAIYCNKPKIKIRFQINNVMMHLVDIEKQEYTKHKISKRK